MHMDVNASTSQQISSDDLNGRSAWRDHEHDPKVQDSCVICLDAITEIAVARPCQHRFDFLCILSWLQEQSSCPLCKTNVSHVEYDFDNGQHGTKNFPIPLTAPKANSTSGEPNRYARSERPPDASWPRSRRRDRAGHTQRFRAPNHVSELNDPLEIRRRIYAQHTFSLHVGSNRLSQFRDVTAQQIATSELLLSRARRWIRRELQVFDFLTGGSSTSSTRNNGCPNQEFLLEYIIAILKTVELKGSGGQAEDLLQDFLGHDTAKLFIHELRAWLRSPYTSLHDWDRNVQYPSPHAACLDRECTRARTSTRNRRKA